MASKSLAPSVAPQRTMMRSCGMTGLNSGFLIEPFMAEFVGRGNRETFDPPGDLQVEHGNPHPMTSESYFFASLNRIAKEVLGQWTRKSPGDHCPRSP